MIRVLLADDEELIRGEGRGAVDKALAHRPDVAVIDLQMPGLSGLEVAAEVAAALESCAVVILTGHGRPPPLRRALLSGARGFVPKGSPAAILAEVIRRVHDGGRYVEPALGAEALLAPECPLTPRELDVLRLADGGVPVATIARQAHLSPGTARNYLAAAVAKLGGGNRADGIARAREHGWL